ncbi:ferritin-like domain-containing protein [Helcobacillus massiliensis]|uniref:DUF4439 domain-containing protein n=1 Tax=Helcobacillus massiliensis TaxID=521392 RepID=A0A839QN99_9MICO|nr:MULTISPECIES: DUF4439 domain-containing protein [Helcobacillus]MBB3021784.1 hypothetical protein [Helcobacillus massiliensis]MCG7427589.1 ferritin-like domain-containing protein [Helcobacillus sp. ACRRO]MCT1557886.1 ferritin-like domain-containing protein [Helcobacillus massiliensis]MCT2036510.1 ferritin-like domain-containing protein [Helcobacillus massiliensis]MCT2332589.1 ferritin-like domain-containing protein [Helcobacillus massiliensis]
MSAATPSPGPISRRMLALRALTLTGAVAAGVTLSGCANGARLRLGQPAQYTPPPPGIDEQYRTDILTALVTAAPVTDSFAAAATGDAQKLSALIAAAMQDQQRAFATAAELEDGTYPSAASPADAAAGAAEVAEQLRALRDLMLEATVQVSASLARITASAGVFSIWALSRLAAVTGDSALAPPAPPSAADLAPTRPVPTEDPAYIDPQDGLAQLMQDAQRDEWFGAYALEVVAARAPKDQRAAHAKRAAVHRSRAESYTPAITALKAEPARREAAYPLTAEQRTDEGLAALAQEISTTSIAHAVRLSSAATFDQRAAFIAAWAEETPVFAQRAASVDSLPWLEEPAEG